MRSFQLCQPINLAIFYDYNKDWLGHYYDRPAGIEGEGKSKVHFLNFLNRPIDTTPRHLSRTRRASELIREWGGGEVGKKDWAITVLHRNWRTSWSHTPRILTNIAPLGLCVQRRHVCTMDVVWNNKENASRMHCTTMQDRTIVGNWKVPGTGTGNYVTLGWNSVVFFCSYLVAT